jgi:gamma-glutamylcyclotransferase (GGCT)/AIG2-like uncharacterized protein YtfP
MPLVFAYGSNMDAQAMAQRCPRGRIVGRARLPGHRVALMPDGYATVVRDRTAHAHGLLWEIGFGDLAALDRYESVATGLYEKIHQPVLREGGAPTRALIYIGRPGKTLGRAPEDYMARIVLAATEIGLPREHVDFLRRLGGEEVAPAKKFRAIKHPDFL